MPQPRNLLRADPEPGSGARVILSPVNGSRLTNLGPQPALARVQIMHAFLHSNSLRARARAVIPGGGSDRAISDAGYPLLSPGFVGRGEGCRVVDADGHTYIEYGAGCCPVGLGHAHPAVTNAVVTALRAGDSFARAPVIETAAAEALISLVPSADMARFFSSTTDALTAGILLARAATGRSGAVRLRSVDSSESLWSEDTSMPEPWDLPAVDDYLAGARAPIGAVVIDAAGDEEPAPGLLADLVALAHRHGAIAILDESTTGFRWSAGGAQLAYGCTPDLSVFGSSATNGLPFAALVGSRSLMRTLPQLETTSYNGFRPLAARGAASHCLAALQAVIGLHRTEGVADALHEIGRKIRDGVRELVQHHGLTANIDVVGRACRPVLRTRDAEGRDSDVFRALLLQETIRRGVLMPTLAPSFAHDEKAVAATLDALDGALDVYARALEDGIDRHLIGLPGGVTAGG